MNQLLFPHARRILECPHPLLRTRSIRPLFPNSPRHLTIEWVPRRFPFGDAAFPIWKIEGNWFRPWLLRLWNERTLNGRDWFLNSWRRSRPRANARRREL